MILLAATTLIVWGLSVWCAAGALRGRGLLHRLRRAVAALAWACVGILLGMVLALRHSFHAFSAETLVARVTTQRLSPEEFELTYVPADHGEAGRIRLRLAGDQWSISGGVVKWHPWLTALGLKSYHRPMRLGGQFSRLEQQRSHLPTVYPLEPAADWFWEALYRVDPILPFVEAVYGSSAYVYIEPGVVQEVYVTHSGYLIKRNSNR